MRCQKDTSKNRIYLRKMCYSVSNDTFQHLHKVEFGHYDQSQLETIISFTITARGGANITPLCRYQDS